MAEQGPQACPICKSLLQQPSNEGGDIDGIFYDCPYCGRFGLTRTAVTIVSSRIGDDPKLGPLLSHYLRKSQSAQERPLFGSDTCKRIFETGTMPTPKEQADNLIRWLGGALPGPGGEVTVTPENHGAIIGVGSKAGFGFIVRSLLDEHYIRGQMSKGGHLYAGTLTFKGWERYEELRRGVPRWTQGIHGDEVWNRTTRHHFETSPSAAVADTGFTLQRLDDDPKAGLIDDRLRVEIQSARFLIADLTHDNNGAYWEAGYAEGLGKPVIYTCEKSHFSDRVKGTHFDTNHHLTVLWSADEPADAAIRLKATIRATIPEAKRGDG